MSGPFSTPIVDEKLIYHNRTLRESVEAAIRIAQHYQLNERDFFIVNVAVWFH